MLHLVPISTDLIPIDADAVAPDRLASKSFAEIAGMSLWHGNREVRMDEVFHLTGDAADGCIEIEGDCSRLKGLGRGMAAGHLLVRGDAGLHLGAEMSGGRIDVFGNAGDWLGAEMRDGQIHVHGNAGNLVGAAYRGGARGMRGGMILIDGNAGDEVGACMRRGLIAVGGRCGDLAGISMIAGSLFAFGGIGSRPGAGMKRGSIVVLQGPVEPPPTFRRTADYVPAFLNLYFKRLLASGFSIPRMKPQRLFRRYGGDLLTIGKGEILAAIADPN